MPLENTKHKNKTMNLKTGHQLAGGRYKVERVLGQGGFGITYLAEQVSLGRKVAVKEFFMKELCNREGDTSHVTVPSIGSREMVDRFRDKFIKEARTLAKLRHRHIVRIIDVFEENGTAYYVMEYIGGGSLGDKVKGGALPESDALRYICQVASALDFVHGKHMMHLDVKPANILLNDDEAVLIDFGLAKQYDDAGTQTSTTPVGISHGYAPMEQYKRGGVGTFSPATDIYSLGATLYKLVTGLTPPDANDVADEGLPALPQHLSANVRAAIEASMQFRRKDRPQSIGEFLEIVESGKLRDESGKMKDDSDGVEDCPPAFRGTSAAEGANDSPSTDDGETVVGNSSGSCHPERSEGTHKHANKEILPPSGRQNDNGGKMRDESGEWRDERKRLGGTSKKRWAIIIAVLVIGAVAALLGTLSGGGSDDTAAERERLAAIAEEQRIEAERLASEQQRLEQERLAQEAAEQQRLESERKAKEEADRKAKEEAERLATEKKRKEEEKKRKEEEAAQTRGTINGHEWVDLGLSVKWATCNVGASSPGDYGRYYAWGETITKSDYSSSTSTTDGKQMSNIAGNSTYDVARREWGGTWCLPTKAEFQELLDNCTWTWTTQNGHNGYKVTSKKNGNSIFLPAAGKRLDASSNRQGREGYYWSATSPNAGGAFNLYIRDGYRDTFWKRRLEGYSVRPVCE